ncbi:MAG TPA: hypothetical protein DCG28_06395 [Lachnospiraceae bacterium]|nr:hypothetical protein [Lachnospiraceae bacterium]
MAFMGIAMMYLAIIISLLGISTFICFSCFVASWIIMLVKRSKSSGEGKIKQPWYVILLRVLGIFFSLPLIFTAVFVIFAVVSSAVDKQTNLPRAVMSYDYELSEKILKKGADPDIRDKNGMTLLMCLNDRKSFVSTNNNSVYDYDYSDDKTEADEKDIKMMKLLLDYGADINAKKTDCGDETQHKLSEYKNDTIEGYNSIYASSVHPCGNTPLIYAVRERSPEIVRFLTENGAQINITNSCGFTPFLMCADSRSDDDGGYEIISILIDKGADINAVTNFKQDINFILIRGNDKKTKMEELIHKEVFS